MRPPLRIAVFISGTGSNLQALINAQHMGHLNIEIVTVICNNPDAGGIRIAQQALLPIHIIHHRDFDNRTDFEHQIMQTLARYKIDLIVLAGFMRILTPTFIHQFYGKMINLHPALLPKFRGLNTHQRALEAKEQFHGSTVHFVSPLLDAGPIISQARYRILPNDGPLQLEQRSKQLEHKLLSQTLMWFADQSISLINNKVFINNQQSVPEGTDLTDIIQQFAS